MAITIRDVAEAAGVSTATVSRALRGLPNVDEQTRERVKSIALDMDYVISPSASRLASGRTGSMAVITPYISRWFFSEVIAGAESVLQKAGIDLLLINVGDYQNGHARIPPTPRLKRRVDGILIVALPPQDPDLEPILKLDMPSAMIGGIAPGVDCVAINDAQVARTATEHLADLGHVRIGLIAGGPAEARFTAESERERGFRAVMNERGLTQDPMLEVFGRFTIDGGEKAMDALLNQPIPPTAVFAMSDEMAFGALRSATLHGLVPGRDISIIGIDNHPMSEYLNLSTVAQPVSELGIKAAERLLAQMAMTPNFHADAVVTELPTRLIVRGSTGKINS
jgi:LacI family transcriptional regulator, repressor for deo operon, udp, cdd, tsx, nupC, and nupG